MAERHPQVLLQASPLHSREAVLVAPDVVHNTVPAEHPLAQYLLRDRAVEIQSADPLNRRGVFPEEQAAALRNMEYVVAGHLVSLATHSPRERTLPVDPLVLRKAISSAGENIPETLFEDILHEKDLALELTDDRQVIIAGYTPEETRLVFGKFGKVALESAGYTSPLSEEHSRALIKHALPVLYNLTHS